MLPSKLNSILPQKDMYPNFWCLRYNLHQRANFHFAKILENVNYGNFVNSKKEYQNDISFGLMSICKGMITWLCSIWMK